MRLIFFIALILPFSAALAKTNYPPPLSNNAAVGQDIFYDDIEVTHVIDGDTFIGGKDRIRLWGINAPEKNKPLYDLSTIALKSFLKNRVRCKHIEIDKYKRNVMQCETLDGVDIGAMMVWTGFAKDFQKYSGGFYKSEQEWARDNKLGIWKNF